MVFDDHLQHGQQILLNGCAYCLSLEDQPGLLGDTVKDLKTCDKGKMSKESIKQDEKEKMCLRMLCKKITKNKFN